MASKLIKTLKIRSPMLQFLLMPNVQWLSSALICICQGMGCICYSSMEMLLPVVQTDEQRYPVGLATEYSHHTMTKRILARSLAESYGLFANFTWLVGIGV